ncbi:MAG: phage baseplate plug family protein [Plesiomonas sp.]
MNELPIKGGAENAHQQFSFQLGDNFLDFTLDYVTYTDTPSWSMNIYRDGTPLVMGAMLVPGCDVIEGYRAGIGRLVFVGSDVTLDNLGVDNHLVWVAQ